MQEIGKGGGCEGQRPGRETGDVKEARHVNRVGVNEEINNLDSAVFAQVSGLEVDSEPPEKALFPFPNRT